MQSTSNELLDLIIIFNCLVTHRDLFTRFLRMSDFDMACLFFKFYSSENSPNFGEIETVLNYIIHN